MPRRGNRSNRGRPSESDDAAVFLGKIETVTMPSSTHTSSVVQLNAPTLGEAIQKFSEHYQGMPMVVIPPKRKLLSYKIDIPGDAYVLLNKWGENYTTGNHSYFNKAGRFWFSWVYQVAALVSKQALTKTYVGNGLPSEDDIKVGVKLTVLFEVVDPYRFVYNIGVLRFDKLLDAAVDESVRVLIRRTPHHRLYDLTGTFADSMKQQLNKQFVETYGVRFTDTTITEVSLPDGLQQLLARIQTFQSLISEENASHIFKLHQISDDTTFSLTEIENKNNLKLLELLHQEQLALADQTLQKAVVGKKRAVLECATWTADSEFIQTQEETKKITDISKVETEIVSRIERAKASKEVELALAKSKVTVMESSALADYTEQHNKIQSAIALANAEAKAEVSFAARRTHQLKLQRLGILSDLVTSGRIVITGKSADRMLDRISNSSS